MTKHGLHVTLAADRRFARPLAVTLASISANVAGRVDVAILHDGFSPALRRKVESGAGPLLSVHWYLIGEAQVDGMHFARGFSSATLYRLLIPALLPDVTRTLYLDADLLVLDDLAPVWTHDLQGLPAAAVHDALSPWVAGTGSDWPTLGMEPTDPYFNAGVMLMDLAAWRRENLAERAAELCRRHRLFLADQDALNSVLANRWSPLPRRWNVQARDVTKSGVGWALDRENVEQAVEDPGILHYTEKPKPWMLGCQHPMRDLWFSYVDRTVWAGWRPSESGARQLWVRARGAGGILLKGV